MPAVRVFSASSDWNDEPRIPDELVGRLYHAGENAAFDLTVGLTPSQRASLAAFCYHKAHLHGIGLAIAATCDLPTLTQTLGTAFGTTLCEQARERPAPAVRVVGGQRGKVTLARSPGSTMHGEPTLREDAHARRRMLS